MNAPDYPSSKEMLTAALAEWDSWSNRREGDAAVLPFNEVLSKRGEALSTMVAAVRVFLADVPPSDGLREALEHVRASAQTGTYEGGVVISFAAFEAVRGALTKGDSNAQ